MKTEEFYNAIGAEKLREISEDYKVSDTTFLDKILNAGDVVLDLACGYGRISIPLAEQGFKVYGIDISEVLIKEASAYSKDLENKPEFLVGNMNKLPYQDGLFNKVLCLWNSFSHLLTKEEQTDCLHEIYRVMKTGGSAVLVLPNDDKWKDEIKKQGTRVMTSEFYGLEAQQFIHDEASLESLLHDTLFSSHTIELTDLDNTKRILVTLNK
jgi:ubiquinone/menaquinone biosynthesis C-methylase UbiE